MALTEITTKSIKDGEIVNADISASADIAGSKIADNAISLAKMASGTDGQIITYDASGDPVAVGPGTDGQVLTSTGAGSPPAFEDLPASGATLSGSTDNTVVTVTGANAMAGEANLKFDGSNLEVNGSPPWSVTGGDYRNLSISGEVANSGGFLWLGNGAAATNGNHDLARINICNNSNIVAQIAGSTETSANDDGRLSFHTKATSGSLTEKVRIDKDGNLKINDGNLVIGTNGHGIDFSAHADVGSSETTTSSILDDYEEGTFTAKMGGSSNYDTYEVTGPGNYIKIGTTVTVTFRIHNQDLDNSASGTVFLFNMPFTGNNFSATNSKAGLSANWSSYNVSFDTNYDHSFYIEPSQNGWLGRASRSGTSWSNWTVDNFVAGATYLDFTGSYRVA
tara:strand:+ start:664 stop:1848 length:1185 start_codon:yes stop_codon:yes gene_type:complete